MKDLRNAFYYMAEAATAEFTLVPEAAELQVRELIDLFASELAKPFAPHVGAHALVFGEWGHGKTQVLYRVAAHMTQQSELCMVLVVIPEDMSPYHLLSAAANYAEQRGLPFQSLRESAKTLSRTDPNDSAAVELAALAFAHCAEASGRPHAALLFDEAQTVQGTSFQHLLKELRQAFRERSIVLHTLQCHSLVSLDRAIRLAQDLEWLQGPTVRKVHLPSLRDTEAHELFRSRLERFSSDLAGRYISPGIARTICRLVGGNPRTMLSLAQELVREVGSNRIATGEDLIRVCERHPGETPGSSLFMRKQLQRLLDLLPQVWDSKLGTKMVSELKKNIGRWFGEDVAEEVSTVADRLDIDVPILERNLRRPVDGITLFEQKTDQLGSVLQLSVECRQYLSRSFAHGGDFNEKQVQFDCLMAPTLQHRAVANALRLTELGEMLPPLTLGTYADGAQIRGYELRYQVPGTSYSNLVLIAPMLGTHWPVEVARKVVERLRRGTCTRVIIVDFVVNRAWLDWENECKAMGLILPTKQAPDLKRIDVDVWGTILPAPRDASDSPAARAAILCAALCGAERARQNQQSPSDDQQRARRGIVDRVRDLLPSSDDLYYLPSQEQQQLLDLPLWSSGVVDLPTLREVLARPQFTGPQLADLIPHWLEESGARKWRRRPWAKTAFALAVLRSLKESRGPQKREQLAERLRVDLPMPHPDRLDSCLQWLLNKLQAEKLVEIDLLGMAKYRDLSQEIREGRTALRKNKSELTRDLAKLQTLSYEKWSEIGDRAQRTLDATAAVATDGGAGGPEALRKLEDALEEVRRAAIDIRRGVDDTRKDISKLINDVAQWVTNRRQQIALVHPAWRDALGLNMALHELEQFESSIKRFVEEGGSQRDQLGRATVEYQRARMWNLRLENLLRNGAAPDDALRTVAAAVLSGNFREIEIGFIPGDL